jgi:hypothetical protein
MLRIDKNLAQPKLNLLIARTGKEKEKDSRKRKYQSPKQRTRQHRKTNEDRGQAETRAVGVGGK